LHLADHRDPGRPDRAGGPVVPREAQRGRRRPPCQWTKQGVEPCDGCQAHRDHGLRLEY
jgi:hypothetical protein